MKEEKFMKQEDLDKATENISLIKDMLERTSKSFISFSRIFIYWGMLFLINSGITIFLRVNKEKITAVNFLSTLLFYVLMVCFFAISAAFIYSNISKKMPLVGLEKTLTIVWLLIIVMNLVPIKVLYNSDNGFGKGVNVIRQTSNPSVLMFSLAIGLILTSLLANYKQPKIVGIFYIGFSVLYAFCNPSLPIDMFFRYLQLVILPFTLIYLGIFLKSKQVRGD